MGDITRNLSRHEFACPCGCGMQDPHPKLVMALQQLCDLVAAHHAKRPYLAITGPGRCAEHNRAVGGAGQSHHIPRPPGYFEAVDCHIYFLIDKDRTRRLPLQQFYDYARTIRGFVRGGIGVYVDEDGPRLHLDVRRTGPARWCMVDGMFVEIDDALEAARVWEAKEDKRIGYPGKAPIRKEPE